MNKMNYYIFLALAIIYGCGKEDATPVAPDATKPVITIVSPSDPSKPLRATVTVKAEATDDSGLAMVEVFVDGSSIASATSSPVEASWDTRTVTDGSHEIKIIAEDTEGNKEEKTITVQVTNTLFTFQIGKYFNSFVDPWIFVSDESGLVFGTQQVKNEETITIDTPEGFSPDKSYSLHIVQYSLQDYGDATDKFYDLESYTNMKPGSYLFAYPQRTYPEIVGTHNLFVTGNPENYWQSGVISTDARTGFYPDVIPILDPYVIPIQADLTKSSADVVYFLLVQDDENNNRNNSPLIYRDEDAMDGEEAIVAFADMSTMDFLPVSFTDADWSSYSLMHVFEGGDYNNIDFLYSQGNTVTPNELRVYNPEILFPEWITELRYKSGDVTYSYEKVGSEINTTFKKLNGDISSFSSSGNSVEYTATGNITYVKANAFEYESDGPNTVVHSWLVYAPGDSKGEILIPDFPSEIKEKYPDLTRSAFVFDSFTLYDIKGISDYNEWTSLRLSDKSRYTKQKEILGLTRSFASSGGRKNGRIKSDRRMGHVFENREKQLRFIGDSR